MKKIKSCNLDMVCPFLTLNYVLATRSEAEVVTTLITLSNNSLNLEKQNIATECSYYKHDDTSNGPEINIMLHS